MSKSRDLADLVSAGNIFAADLTANNAIIGNGEASVQFVAPGDSGNILTSNGTTWTSAANNAASTGKAIAMAIVFG